MENHIKELEKLGLSDIEKRFVTTLIKLSYQTGKYEGRNEALQEALEIIKK